MPLFCKIVSVFDLHFQGQNSNRVHWEVPTVMDKAKIVWPFSWQIYISSLAILKVKVKLMHILTVPQTVTDRINNTITNAQSQMWPID